MSPLPSSISMLEEASTSELRMSERDSSLTTKRGDDDLAFRDEASRLLDEEGDDDDFDFDVDTPKVEGAKAAE
jgi:hypothetical protein